MKYAISILTVLGVSVIAGCQAPKAPEAAAKVAAIAPPAAPVCAFDQMILNGASAASPTKTSYTCHTTPSNAPTDQFIYIALRTDGSAYFGIGAAGGSVTPQARFWGVDSANCEIVIMTAPSSGETHRLRAPLLHADKKLSAVDVRTTSNGAILASTQCYYDTSPGF